MVGLEARIHDVALLVPRRHQQITGRLHPFVDQRVCQLLSLVEQQDGLVGDLFLRIHLSLLQLAFSVLQLVLNAIQLSAQPAVVLRQCRDLVSEPCQVVGEGVEKAADLIRVEAAKPDREVLATSLIRTQGTR